MPNLDLSQIPQYYSCPVCSEMRSLTKKPPRIVILGGQILGVCPECADKLRNGESINAEPVHVGFGPQRHEEPCDHEDTVVNAVSELMLNIEDDEDEE
jgi:hypothetical protein